MYPLFNNYRIEAIQSLPFPITPFLHDGLKRETKKKVLKATGLAPRGQKVIIKQMKWLALSWVAKQ